jgi:hypothetical protein
VGGEVKEARGKGTEEYHLRRFIECFPEFPDGKLTLSEHPDFLLETSDAIIGIEHTRYINSDLGAKESVENVALRLASQTYESKGYPPVEVRVLWNFDEKPTKRTMHQFVDTLSEFVASHLPSPGDEVAIRYPHWAWRQVPQEIISLTISRRRTMDSNFWVSTRGGFVAELTSADLHSIIRKKEGKVSSYRRSCTQVWLLIVANGFEPSTHCDLAPEIEGFQFETNFDRVFYLHSFAGMVVELSPTVPPV